MNCINRVAHRHLPFSQLGNAMIRDKRVSREARFALCFILTHPADWAFTTEWLCRELELGRDKARAIISELVSHGYCTKHREKTDNGQFGRIVYVFTDMPDKPSPETQGVDDGGDVPPVTGDPATAGQAHNTNKGSPNKVTNTPVAPKGAPTPGDALKAFEAYNQTALRCALQQAGRLTPDRQRKIIARLRDYGLDGWMTALANLERSAFLRGKNDRNWRANLDFLLQASSFSKVHDGQYGGAPAKAAAAPVNSYAFHDRAPDITDPRWNEYIEGIARKLGVQPNV